MRVRLDLAYDGSAFSGWAKQPERRTVEGTVDDALWKVLRLDGLPGLTVAGRTDAGVHARGQVAHVDVPAAAWAEHHERLLYRLRSVLPDDVQVAAIQLAPEGFDARFGANSRRYTYRMSDDPTGVAPLRRHDTVWHRRPLDLSAMSDAAIVLLGEHDFAAFCKRRDGASTVRTLLSFSWTRRADGVLEASVVADAFCHNMVRSLVGACVVVGETKQLPSWVVDVLALGERSSAVPVMPPHGLTLEEVTYPPDDELAVRAVESRRFRG